MQAEILRMEAVTVRGGGQPLLENLSLTLTAGDALGIHSGQATVKQALCDVIAVAREAEAGRLYLDGEPCLPEMRPQLREMKVAVVRSAQTLIDTLTVAENIFIVRKKVRAWSIRRTLLVEQTRLLMAELGLEILPDIPVSRLSRIEKCLLQMAKAYALGGRLLILQDISSFLPDTEIGRVRELTHVLRGRGMGILTVDSAPEVLGALSDQVAVLSGGAEVWRMNGRECALERNRPCFEGVSPLDAGPEPEVGLGTALLFDRVDVGCGPLSFSLEPGGGLLLLDRGGTAIEAIRRCLTGETVPLQGTIRTAKGILKRAPLGGQDPQIAIIPENPGEAAVFPDLSGLENLCHPMGTKIPGFWMRSAYRRSIRREYEGYFAPQALRGYPDQMTRQERHRLAYLRWHLYNPAVVVCIRPFSSVDATLNTASAACIRLLRKRGIAVLVLATNDTTIDAGLRKLEVPKNGPLHPNDALCGETEPVLPLRQY